MTAGQADLAIGPLPPGWTGPVRTLGTEEFVVAVPADDPLAVQGVTEIGFAALRDRRWVHYGPDNGLAAILDRACHDAGFRPRTAVRAEQTASAPTLAAAGLGPALFPANLVPDGYEGHILRPDPAVTRVLAAYARTRLDELSSAFLAVLVENASGLLTPSPV